MKTRLIFVTLILVLIGGLASAYLFTLIPEPKSEYYEVTWEHDPIYTGYQVVEYGHSKAYSPVWDSCGAGDCTLSKTIVHEKFKDLAVKGKHGKDFITVQSNIRQLTRYEYDCLRRIVEISWPEVESVYHYEIYKRVPVGKTSKRLELVYHSCERSCQDNAEILSIHVGPGEDFKVMAVTSSFPLNPKIRISNYE